MVVLGQYGVERWDAASGEFSVPPDPEEITRVAEELPSVLARLGLERVRIEHKGRAIGIHTRQLDDPAGAFDRLLSPLTELASGIHCRSNPARTCWRFAGTASTRGMRSGRS